MKEKSGKISTIKNTLDYAVQNCSMPLLVNGYIIYEFSGLIADIFCGGTDRYLSGYVFNSTLYLTGIPTSRIGLTRQFVKWIMRYAQKHSLSIQLEYLNPANRKIFNDLRNQFVSHR